MASLWTVRRSVSDAKLTGLCGGIARHWNVDPLLVRIGFALLTLCGGLGVVAYVGGWLFVPQEGHETSYLDELTGGATARWSREARLGVVVGAAIVVFGLTSSFSPVGFWPVVVLAAVWYFGFHRRRQQQNSTSSGPPASPSAPLPPPPFRYPGPATPFTEAAQAWQQRVAEHLAAASGVAVRPDGTAPPAATPPPTASAAATPTSSASAGVPASQTTWPVMPTGPGDGRGPQDPVSGQTAEHAAYLSVPDPVGLYAEDPRPDALRREAAPSRRLLARSLPARRLRLTALVVLGLTLSGLGVADALGAGLGAVDYLAAALLVVGLTLIAATWFGRARGILPAGVLLAVVLLAVSVVGPGTTNHTWTDTRSYVAVSQLPAAGDRFDGGTFDVDLRGLELSSDATYTATVDWGALEVQPPAGTTLRVRYRLEQAAAFDGDTALGTGSTTGVLEPAAGAGGPTLTLDLTARFGAVRIVR